MCTRYSITSVLEEIATRFSVDVPESYQPNYNAAPTHLLPVVTQESQNGVSFFYWGAPPLWANKKALGEKLINTRLEHLAEKPALRKKLREKRCLILADGFYEWKKIGKKSSIPYRFTLRSKAPFAMAGLWEEYDDEHDEMNHTFTIITMPANSAVSPITERMPLILSPENEKSWLAASEEEDLINILKKNAPELDFYSVSPRVNSPDKNDRLIILPAPASDQHGNLTLFD